MFFLSLNIFFPLSIHCLKDLTKILPHCIPKLNRLSWPNAVTAMWNIKWEVVATTALSQHWQSFVQGKNDPHPVISNPFTHPLSKHTHQTHIQTMALELSVVPSSGSPRNLWGGKAVFVLPFLFAYNAHLYCTSVSPDRVLFASTC